jgi:hypothetical protein
MRDSLPNVTLGTYLNLLQICFVNQAFLGLQFFQVQGRSRASYLYSAATKKKAGALLTLPFLKKITIISKSNI